MVLPAGLAAARLGKRYGIPVVLTEDTAPFMTHMRTRRQRALVKEAPYRESGHRLLMQTLAARGNTAEAVQVYETLRRLLRDELGVAPSAPTQALHRELIR